MIEDAEPAVDYPIDGTLDLHMFAPEDTHEVVKEYIAACLRKNILRVRIVHGKGIGVKRQIVQKLLGDHPNVVHHRHEGGPGGGWGATVVDLKP